MWGWLKVLLGCDDYCCCCSAAAAAAANVNTGVNTIVNNNLRLRLLNNCSKKLQQVQQIQILQNTCNNLCKSEKNRKICRCFPVHSHPPVPRGCGWCVPPPLGGRPWPRSKTIRAQWTWPAVTCQHQAGGDGISEKCDACGVHLGMISWDFIGFTLWLCQNSYWKWPFIVDFPIKNGDFP